MTRFLIDSNALIDAARDFYRFKNFPKVWVELTDDDAILTIPEVYKEIQQIPVTPLAHWALSALTPKTVAHSPATVAVYQDIIQWITTSGYWTTAGYAQWVHSTKADPWLIASARAAGYTIVSHERAKPAINIGRPSSKEPKITTVADYFGVEVVPIFEMLSRLSFVSN